MVRVSSETLYSAPVMLPEIPPTSWWRQWLKLALWALGIHTEEDEGAECLELEDLSIYGGKNTWS